MWTRRWDSWPCGKQLRALSSARHCRRWFVDFRLFRTWVQQVYWSHSSHLLVPFGILGSVSKAGISAILHLSLSFLEPACRCHGHCHTFNCLSTLTFTCIVTAAAFICVHSDLHCNSNSRNLNKQIDVRLSHDHWLGFKNWWFQPQTPVKISWHEFDIVLVLAMTKRRWQQGDDGSDEEWDAGEIQRLQRQDSCPWSWIKSLLESNPSLSFATQLVLVTVSSSQIVIDSFTMADSGEPKTWSRRCQVVVARKGAHCWMGCWGMVGQSDWSCDGQNGTGTVPQLGPVPESECSSETATLLKLQLSSVCWCPWCLHLNLNLTNLFVILTRPMSV